MPSRPTPRPGPPARRAATPADRPAVPARTPRGGAPGAPARPRGSARLTIHINGVPYGARPIPAPAYGGRAWRLRHFGDDRGTAYCVAETPDGPTCDCGDCTFRDRPCKHVLALIALTLLSADPIRPSRRSFGSGL